MRKEAEGTILQDHMTARYSREALGRAPSTLEDVYEERKQFVRETVGFQGGISTVDAIQNVTESQKKYPPGRGEAIGSVA